ncbi:MAG: saccharopine dehydrogenase NADP-binding domain-containing protein [Candidatus Heimdallarchaeota archaeon]|nr:MAG: saccharopine dehydrogenase NADP-binding domain-containing protein [Candidatus Heimdallarchaeota archaeon]
MKVLLLGVGLQGKVALHDLVKSDTVSEVIAADLDIASLKQLVETKQYAKVRCEFLDANNQENINQLMALKPDIVIDLLPIPYVNRIAKSAIKTGINLINTLSLSPEMKELAGEAKSKGITVLPEFGLDPGIDLVLLGQALRGMEDVEVINSYGAGIPTLEAADNPINYKVTWSLEGVLSTYFRKARIIRNGRVVQLKGNELFSPENIHDIKIDDIGKLEAFPNGDVLRYLPSIGIEEHSDKFKLIKEMGRYTMRWPGHCAFWKKLVDLHLLDDEPIVIDGNEINRQNYLAKVIGPHIQLENDEKDLAILLIEVIGKKNSEKTRVIYQLIDKRDLITGFTAMSRTVGYTVSIGAQMIGNGKIAQTGILSPVNDIPYDIFKHELNKRGINIRSYIESF